MSFNITGITLLLCRRRGSALFAATEGSVVEQDLNLGPEAQPAMAGTDERHRGCACCSEEVGDPAGQTRQTRETISERDNRQPDGIIP